MRLALAKPKRNGREPYRVICADPPWRFSDKLPGVRGAESHYDTLSAEQIKAYALPPIADDAILFLWRVSAMPQLALDVCAAWGFQPKAEIVWVKTSRKMVITVGDELEKGLAYGLGRYVRGAHEACIVARRGKFKVTDAGDRSVFFAPRGEHSAKPREFYDLVERMVGAQGPKLDLFGRCARSGWTVIGEVRGESAAG